MVMPISTNGITGTDGAVPIYQPNARWTIWSLHELYMGTVGANRYVPKINDYVVNPDTDEQWKVIDIDPVTLVPRLDRVRALNVGGLTNEDMLLGVGPGTQSDTYRIYIDKSVTPHTLAVDARLSVAGSMVSKAIIFRGSELDGTAVAISAQYDQQGTLLGQAIPLELVGMTGQNIAIKTVPVCHTLANLPDGEVVTAVFYSDAGKVVSKRQLLVENTAFIRSADAAMKYITGVSLESPFLSASDPRLIQYPLNVPLEGLNLIGVVHYSDGTVLKMPVDNTKFKIFGFDGFISTIIGQQFSLVLKYALAKGEVAYGVNSADGQFITEIYKATTVKANGAFTVKLFAYPVWIDAANGYRLEWFMYNLDRTNAYRVTPYVKFNANSHAFDPTAYGIVQHLSVSLNLKDVNGLFANYIHVQTMDISLMGPGTARTTNWTLTTSPGQTSPFGTDNFAAGTFVNQNLWRVNLASGAANLDAWLKKMYYNTMPLTDTTREVAPPMPNYFSLIVGSTELEFPIAEWNITHDIAYPLQPDGTLFIKFIYRTPDNDIQLSVAGIPLYQQ